MPADSFETWIQPTTEELRSETKAHLLFLHPTGPWVIGAKQASNEIFARLFTDVDGAVEFAHAQSNDPGVTAVYTALHRVANLSERFTLGDKNVSHYANLLIDLDRAGKLSENASDEELARCGRALEAACNVLCELAEAEPLQLMSGNGAQAIFPLAPIPAAGRGSGQRSPIKRALEGADSLLRGFFSDFGLSVTVDTAVSNPGRWTRLAGTMNRKYPESEGRPHRPARLLNAGAERRESHPELLARLEGHRATATQQRREEKGLTLVRMRAGINLREELAKVIKLGGSYEGVLGGVAGVFHPYHGIDDQPCLIAERLHRNRRDPKVSAFFESEGGVCVTCFNPECRRTVGKTRRVLFELGLDILEEPRWRVDRSLY